ncbi:hypothetical protein [Thiohalomonas denitrificans]|uniref:Cofactor-independent phosphoglycerate mutase n=1 Tax=Thiohalomonas denitrificans TaxID=415747 RepID=A0A1G5Q2K9_9GAMM|nr:hypothetical protein [Thiohalomonas denitrificans]SCZ56104.1 hypothetical protein SAMN03097708_01271 [Thiohalomonas denitrificans]
MTDSSPVLAVVAPWLLEAAAVAGRAPALETLFWRGRRRKHLPESASRLYWHLFDRTPVDGDLPVGALCRYADTGEAFEGCWLKADPVHLVADRDRVMLTGTVTGLEFREIQSLVKSFNDLFGEDGWQLEAGTDGLRMRTPLSCAANTTPVDEVVGRDIHPLLPDGPDRLEWHRFLTELQMLLHGSPINEERDASGCVPVNSLWPWGAGELPRSVASPWGSVHTRDGFVTGLTRRGGGSVEAVPDSFDRLPNFGHRLLALPAPNSEGWELSMSFWEEQWFLPLVKAVRAQRLGRLLLYPGNGWEVTITSGRLRRFWRRPRPLKGAV